MVSYNEAEICELPWIYIRTRLRAIIKNNDSFSCQQPNISHVKQQRHRYSICFDPPHSRAVITNVAKKFLQLLDQHLPPSNKFYKTFNGNNMKVSYCCTQNVGNIIESHKNKPTNSSNYHAQPYKFRKKGGCAMEAKRRTKNIVYKYIVWTYDQPDKAHSGTAGRYF